MQEPQEVVEEVRFKSKSVAAAGNLQLESSVSRVGPLLFFVPPLLLQSGRM